MKNTVRFAFGTLFFVCFPMAIALLSVATPLFFTGNSPAVSVTIIVLVAPICTVLSMVKPTFKVVRELVTPDEHVRLVIKNLVRQNIAVDEEWIKKNKASYTKLYIVSEKVYAFKLAVLTFYEKKYSVVLRASLFIISLEMMVNVFSSLPDQARTLLTQAALLNFIATAVVTTLYFAFGQDTSTVKEA